MKKHFVKSFAWVGIISLFLVGFLVIFFAKNMIETAYKGENPFLQSIIQTFYPRFLTEKHRFSVDFFLQKIQQIGIRLVLLGIFFGFFWLFFEKIKSKIQSNIQEMDISDTQIMFLQRYFCVFLLWCVCDWGFILYNLSELDYFYQPVFLLRFFWKENPSFGWLILGYLVMVMAILAVFVGSFFLVGKGIMRFCWAVIFLTFLVLEGYIYSFHKIDHTFAPVNYVCFLMIFCPLIPKLGGNTKGMQTLQTWLFGVQLSMAMCYTLAGTEKLLIGGNDWIFDAPLQYHLQASDTYLGSLLAKSWFLCWFFGFLVLVWEMLFLWVVLFLRKLLPLMLIGGVLFHLGTFLLMNVGGFPHPWVCLYVFFLENVIENVIKQRKQENIIKQKNKW